MNYCKLCKSTENLQLHHLFSQTRLNKKLYGNLIHDFKNIMVLCEECHLHKPIPKWSEIRFCTELGIEPRSKTGKEIWARLKKEDKIDYLSLCQMEE